MIDYSDKFKLKGKKAVIFGGCGLLGQKITEALVLSGAKTFVFDINKIEKGFAYLEFWHREMN